jgi:hypothetical protein
MRYYLVAYVVVIQVAIFFCVCCWGIHLEHVTGERFGYAPAFMGWLAAYLFTVVVVKIRAAIRGEHLPPPPGMLARHRHRWQ